MTLKNLPHVFICAFSALLAECYCSGCAGAWHSAGRARAVGNTASPRSNQNNHSRLGEQDIDSRFNNLEKSVF